MQNYESRKKVKTFRINKTTEYKLKMLSEMYKQSEGKILEKLIIEAYYKTTTNKKEYNKEIERIINTEWVEKY